MSATFDTTTITGSTTTMSRLRKPRTQHLKPIFIYYPWIVGRHTTSKGVVYFHNFKARVGIPHYHENNECHLMEAAAEA